MFSFCHLRRMGIKNQILEDELKDRVLELYENYKKDFEVCRVHAFSQIFISCCVTLVLLKIVELNY